jgi:hypothetical protein
MSEQQASQRAQDIHTDPILVGLRKDAAQAWEQAVRTSQGYLGMIPAGTKESQEIAWKTAVNAQAFYTLALDSHLNARSADFPEAQ